MLMVLLASGLNGMPNLSKSCRSQLFSSQDSLDGPKETGEFLRLEAYSSELSKGTEGQVSRMNIERIPKQILCYQPRGQNSIRCPMDT